MDQTSTRLDLACDAGQVDMGFHAIQPDHGLELRLNAPIITPGTLFQLEYFIHNAGSEDFMADVYIILDVYGSFWCYPGWTNINDQLDFKSNINVAPGYYRYHETVLRFTWPDNAGSAMGLKFYGAAFDAGSFNLIGDLNMIDWGFVQ